MITLRPANQTDVAAAMDICSQARAFQRACGNIQWADGYPSEETIARDIAASKGYIAEVDGVPAGYCVIDIDGDAEYDRAPGLWSTDEPYVAVHRLAMADCARGKGLSAVVFRQVERIVSARGFRVIKVDTGLHNIPMHRLMANLGFTCCGEHTFPWGRRLTYEKVIAGTPVTQSL